MSRISVRAHLVGDTHDLHQSLHSIPVFSKLVCNDLTQRDYVLALRRFHAFFNTIELARQKRSWWGKYALQAAVQALSDDLNGQVPAPYVFSCTSLPEALGALYVAHGSYFGRKAMRRSVTNALPALPHQFMNQPASTKTWQALCQDLDAQGQTAAGYLHVLAGARNAFDLMLCLAERGEERCQM